MLPSDPHLLSPRRIRHITSIQIRNFTPFPLRDSFTSSLSHPLDLTTTTDDLASIRKRPRKSSTRTSLNGIFEHDSTEHRGRPAPSASTSLPLSSSPSTLVSSPPRSIHSTRAARPRTNSMTSSITNHPSTSTASGPLPTVSFLPNNSQTALQNVIGSRLVETFIVISIPTNLASDDPGPSKSKPLRSAPLHKPSLSSSAARTPKTGSSPHFLPTETSPSKTSPKHQYSPPESAPPHRTSFKASATTSKIVSKPKSTASPRLNGTLTSSTEAKGKSPERPIQGELHSPVYFSPIHRPSTNPYFPLDARSTRDFPQSYDISGQRLKVEIWGKKTHDLGSKVSQSRVDAQGWSLLQEWDFHLDKLVPLPHDVDTNPSSLPSNTLVLSLTPPGEVLYLPLSTTALSRPSTPSAGYASDPESEIRKSKQTDQSAGNSEINPLSRRRRRKRLNSATESRDTARTAGWQDLFKLVTLQSCVLDNEASVADVIRKIDGLLDQDATPSLRRQISEREARIKDLERDRATVLDEISRKRAEIAARKEILRGRSELLKFAQQDFLSTDDLSEVIVEERDRLRLLHENMHSIRTSLLSTLSAIFPIELLSPPDLLFTILDVPLPIPLNASDPAPPLTLADHKEVTEEAVATALGYVAQVLQILAAYIGKNLIYPVTCIGSRSLIRDGISAMVGPRMFPLFSKGVDTYRFEYGVFLLNKDIEMLMSERDLRALDIRHTLPNLKNLILTLSHDTGSTIRPIKRSQSVISVSSELSGLETPSREPSPTNDDVSTPKASHTTTDLNGVDRNRTPSASRPTTPTAALDDGRKAKSFLGFGPFTDFLRNRYPSTSQGSISDKHTGEEEEAEEEQDKSEPGDADIDDADIDEDDRRTIHGLPPETPGGPSHLDVQSTGNATIDT